MFKRLLTLLRAEEMIGGLGWKQGEWEEAIAVIVWAHELE